MSDKRIEDQLMDLASRLFLQENSFYTAGGLAQRFQRSADANRQDTTIQQVARVISSMATRDPAKELSSQDLQALGEKFWTNGTTFAEEFTDLLNPQGEQQAHIASKKRHDYSGDVRVASELRDTVAEVVDIYDDEQPIEQLVDPSLTYAHRDLPLFRYAATLVDEELTATSRIVKATLKLKYQTPELLLYEAAFQTPAGAATVYVPVELRDGNPLMPQVMTANDKVYSLDASGVDSLTEDLTYATYNKQAEAAKRLRADLGLSDLSLRSDARGEIEVDELDDDLPQTRASLGIAEIENVLKDAVYRKDSSFDEISINYGRDLVAIELHDIGYKNSQVKFAGDWERGLRYIATVNTDKGKLDIEVPVESSRGSLLNPSVFAYANEVHDLSRQSISKLTEEDESQIDINPLLVSMSYPDLKKQLKRAAHQHSPKLAQMVIELISEKFGEYYKYASIDDYQTWLEEATASYKARCGDCTYYAPKTAIASADKCNLIKTACKSVRKDAESGICTRSIFAEDEQPESILFDTGLNLKL